MSLLKIINGANNDKDFIPKIHEYIVDDVKTDKGQLVGTSNCFRKHAVKDFMTVKKLHHKTHGRQGMNNNKFFEHANTNCNYENEVPFDVQSDLIYNQQIPTQIPQPYMSPVPSAPQFYPEPVPQNMYPTNPPVNLQQYPVPDAYHPYAGPTQQN